jgi:hypothetical protein
MVADGTVEPKYYIGVLADDIANGDFGYAIHFGSVIQVNTNAFNDGDVLWVDPSTPGGFTSTEPNAPNVKLATAIVLNSATNGKIFVRVQGNEGLHELHDVNISSAADGQMLVWDNTNEYWFNDGTLTVDYTNNNIGIGTTSPSQKLEVAGQILATGGDIIVNSSSGNFRSDYAGNGLILSKYGVGSKNAIRSAGDSSSILYINDSASGWAEVRYHADVEHNWYTGGSFRMRINSSGNVGIGTTSPSEKLHVIGGILSQSTGLDSSITLNNTTATTGRSWSWYSLNNGNIGLYDNTSGNYRIVADTSGNVGIGTTSPSTKTHIYDTFDPNDSYGYLLVENGNTTSGSSATNAAVNVKNYHGTSQFMQWEENGLRFGSRITANGGAGNVYITSGNDSVAMTLLSGGNVGIGTTSPSYKLQVSNGTNTYSVNPTSGGIDLHSSGNISTHYQNDYYVFSGNLGSGTPRMHIDSNGNMQVLRAGNTNKGTLLLGQSGSGTNKWSVLAASHYNQDTGSGNGVGSAGVMMIGCYSSLTENVVYIGGNPWEVNPATAIAFNTHTSTVDTAGGTERMRINSSGNVGIGTSSPAEKLQVAGNIFTAADSTAHQIRCYHDDNSYSELVGYGVRFGRSASYMRPANSNAYMLTVGDNSYRWNEIRTYSNEHNWYAGGTFMARLNSTGLGIGTTSPSAKLEVVGEAWVGNGTDGIKLSYSAGNSTGIVDTEYTSTGLEFRVGGSEKMRINSIGRVSIGTDAPTANTLTLSGTATELDITNTSTNGRSYRIESDSAGLFVVKDRTANADRIVMNSLGNVGIGTTSPSYKLHVNGDFRAASSFSSYIQDGLYGSTAKPSVIGTPSGQKILFGYWDNGAGGYFPRIGFQQDYDSVGSPYTTTSKSSIGLEQDGAFTIKGGSSNAERIRILASGGITFNGDTAAANALDDYEEGTWTPGLNGYSGITYSQQTGHYTKIGRLVKLTFSFTISNIGTFAGNPFISGAPFSAGTTDTKSTGGHLNIMTALKYTRDHHYVAFYNGGTSLFVYTKTGGAMNGNDHQAGTYSGTIVYFTS